LDRLAKKYRDKIQFVFVYCQEFHPSRGEYPIPPAMGSGVIPDLGQIANRAEREERARDFRRLMKGSFRRILVDEDDVGLFSLVQNTYKARVGAHIILVDTNGRIVRNEMGVRATELEMWLQDFWAKSY
jgi:hypothetical protein